MSRAETAAELMLCEDAERAKALAEGLSRENRLRQDTESDIFNEITEYLDENAEIRGKDFLVLSSETWHAGVLGSVASKVAERFYKPVALIRMENGLGKGSGRSVAGLNLYEALRSAEDCLEAYGGHEMAVGLTVTADRLGELDERLNQYAREHVEPSDKAPVLLADAETDMEELDSRAVEQLGLMAPFGRGNPHPCLIMRALRILSCKPLGVDKAHLKFRLAQKNRQLDAVAFQMGAGLNRFKEWESLNVLFVPEFNHWNGETKIQMIVQDIKAWNMPDDPFAPDGAAGEIAGEAAGEIAGEIAGVGEIAGAGEAAGETAAEIAGPGEAVGETAGEIAGAGREAAAAIPSGAVRRRSGPERREMIREAILGDRDYHPKQKEALAALENGRNTLLVMGTGRGKTAVFQTVAAELAMNGQISVLIYPLRSLVNDQYQRMRRQFEALDVAVLAVNGSMSASERNRFFQSYGRGKADVVLTTPEFISFHQDKFMAAAGRIGLFVVDEAHHMSQGGRKGYLRLPGVWEKLGRPLTLAATATAGDETAEQISGAFHIREWVLEDHLRANLRLTDCRKERDKLAYLVKIAGRREKTVIYVNSRRQSMELAQTLRDYLPFAEKEIGFYHGGLDPDNRRKLESMFRDTELRIMVSTSAFGEGVDIPDIRHVILYHMCFSKTEFNQLSGRAGRNQEEAWIHLLFNQEDRALNRMLLEQKAPDRDLLAKFYLMLRALQKGRRIVESTDAELAGRLPAAGNAGSAGSGGPVRDETVSACLAILEEIGLLRLAYTGNRRYIHMVPPPASKLDLSDSVRFAEGQGEREDFEEFADYVTNSGPEEILSGFNRPILPGHIRACQEVNRDGGRTVIR
jgi:single-stranded-DNA-specific exonuclease